jgi:hypothetical protein
MIVIPQIYLWSAGSALLSVVGMIVAHKFVKPIDLAKHQAGLDATLNIVGTLVSILLGLLVAACLGNYQMLETGVDAEAAGVIEIARLSFGLPAIMQRELAQTCLDYSEQVATDEWPLMAEGRSSDKVQETYVKLLKSIVKFKPKDNGETNLQTAMLTSMQSVGDLRRQRILWLYNNWTRNLLPVLIMCSLIVIVFAYLYVRRGALLLHGFLICFVATALGANLGLLFLLSNPFRGDWQIQPKGFIFNQQLIRKYADLGNK